MTADPAAIRDARHRDRRAVHVGTAVTGIATLALFVLPDLLPVEAIRLWYFELTGEVVRGNPFTVLRFGGGLVGGAAAGVLTSDLGVGAVAGMKAALYGLVVAYLLAIAYYVLYAIAVANVFPPPLLTTASIPLIYALPLFGVHLIGGAVTGFLAHRFS